MNIHWKIFNVINFICLTLIISLIGWPLFKNSRPLNNAIDLVFYVFVILIPMVVTINCLHNLSLTKVYTASEKLTIIRKISFWILLALFTLIILACIYQFFNTLHILMKSTGAYKPYLNLRIFIQVLSISVTGIYIILMQVNLFFKINRSYRQGLDNFIDEIGS